MTQPVSLTAQIEELEYELRMRRQVYSRLDTTQPRGKSEREMHVEHMEAALKTLRWLKANETKVRTAIGEQV